MYFKEKELQNNTNKQNSEEKNKLIKENLTCFISKKNIFDDPNIILGYPIVKETSDEIYPISEILSYEGYLAQIYNENSYNINEEKSLKSANNKYSNSWLPIYINKNNFEANKQTILNSFSVIKYGISGEKDYDFKPEYIYDIMFKLVNKMICDIKEQKFSSSYLRAFLQYIFLFKKLSILYPYDHDFDKLYDIDSIMKSDLISEIGDIIVVSILDKFAILQIKLYNIKEAMKNYLAFLFFSKKKYVDLKSPYRFLKYLEKNNLFNSIYEIMRFERNLFLYNGKNLKTIIKKIICNSFKHFVFDCDESTRNNLKKFIMKNLDFYSFIDFNDYEEKELDEKTKKDIKDIFDNFAILIYFRDKINDVNFLNQLENNFSVYLDIDEMILKINEILNRIDIYQMIGIDCLNKPILKNIQNIIEEIFIIYNKINKFSSFGFDDIYLEDLWKDMDFLSAFNKIFNNGNDSFEEYEEERDFLYFYPFPIRNEFNELNQYKKYSNSFYELENMKLNNLELLYLYTYERMKKRINPDIKSLSLIESTFIECNLNIYKENDEWFDYISNRQKYENKKRRKSGKDSSILSQKQILNLFHEAKKINEKLLTGIWKLWLKLKLEKKYDIKKGIETKDLFKKIIINNIIKFAETIRESKRKKKLKEKTYIIINLKEKPSNSCTSKYYVERKESLIKKLIEIYDTGNLSLLTFYEFIWFEENFNFCNGFLSSLENYKMYNFFIRDGINKIKEAKKPDIKKINKKDKILDKQIKNQILKPINNKSNIFYRKKCCFKTFIPYKTKGTYYFKFIHGKTKKH